MNTIEKIAKTSDLAIQEALEELKVGKDEVEIEILEEGKAGIFGMGSKPARVRISVKYSPVREAREFLDAIAAKVPVEYEIEHTEKQISIKLSGENVGILIGKRGATLDSLQYLLNLCVNKGGQPYINIIIDAEGYRQRRKETLEKIALGTASRVKRFKKSISLEPMSSYDRKIIHLALQNDRYISTFSEGAEPYRSIVISPKSYSYSKSGYKNDRY